MKIAIISSYGVYCGIARYTYHLAEELIKQKQNVVIFARYKQNGESYEKTLKKLPLKVIRCWENKNLNKNLNKIKKEILKYNPDVIHIQDICRIEKIYKEIYKLFPGKIIATFHSVGAPKVTFHNVSKISDETFVNRVKPYINHFIVHNKPSKKFFFKKNKIPLNKISVIDHGTLSCKKISKSKARKKLNLPKNAILLLTYGFFGSGKGIQEILKVLPHLIKNIPNIYYLHLGRKRLLGRDSYHKAYEKIKEIIKKEGLKNRVKFVWKYCSEKEVQFYCRAADLILLYYPRKNPLLHSSGAAHQIISSGRPVIASNVSTFSEFPKKAMYKIPYSLLFLKKAIIEVLKNKKLQKNLIKNALRYSKASSWKNTCKKHLRVYEKIK